MTHARDVWGGGPVRERDPCAVPKRTHKITTIVMNTRIYSDCLSLSFLVTRTLIFVWAAGASDLTTGAARKRQTAETVVRAGLGV